MTRQSTTKVYWGEGSVGDRHWVNGQAYPPAAKEHYDVRRVMEFTGEYWGVMVENLPEKDLQYFRVGIPPQLPFEEYYDYLVGAVEAQLGRTGLNMLVW